MAIDRNRREPHALEGSANEVAYRSTQMLMGLWIVLSLVLGLVWATTWNLKQPAVGLAITCAASALSLALLGRLVIEVRGRTLRWRYGFLGWPRWAIALDEIVAIQPARGPALHAGIQFKGRQRVFTASLGSPALEFRLADGRRVLLGTPEPDRLASFVRARAPALR